MNKFKNYLATFGGLLALACACAFPATAKVNQTFTPIDVPNATRTDAWGINPAGEITGSYTDAGGKDHPYLLSNGSFTTLDPPFDFSASLTHGITPSGNKIVGCYFDLAGTMHSLLI